MKTIEQKILKFVDQENLISDGDRILIALSGGPDSVCITHILHKFQRRFKIELNALHINHQLRGVESTEDENFCRMICERYKINFFANSTNVAEYAKENKMSIEEAGRVIRYRELSAHAGRIGCTKIITGHNMNDNTETVLLNLYKGTGASGLSGIPVKRDSIIRPLLILNREEILSYLKNNRIEFRIDESNEDTDFQRNFIRHKIIPLIKQNINPALDEATFKSSQIMKMTASTISGFVESASKKYIQLKTDAIEIDLRILTDYDIGFFGEFLRFILNRNFKHDFSYDDFLAIVSLSKKQVGKKMNISDSVFVIKERGKLVICKSSNDSDFEPIEIKIGETKNTGKFNVSIQQQEHISDDFSRDSKTETISADDIEDTFIIRRWRHGDKFKPLGLNNFKKVSDFLSEQKIEAINKKNQLILENRNKIVWILGLRIDNRFKVNKQTKRYCKLWMT